MVYVPDAGDVVWRHFDPQVGDEQAGLDPTENSLQFHRIEQSKDPHCWSSTGPAGRSSSPMSITRRRQCPGRAGAERGQIEAHPRTSAIRVVEVRERLEQVAPPAALVAVDPVREPVIVGPYAATGEHARRATVAFARLLLGEDAAEPVRLVMFDADSVSLRTPRVERAPGMPTYMHAGRRHSVARRIEVHTAPSRRQDRPHGG